MKIPISLAFICISFIVKGQIIESFTDGNFSTFPTWTGSTSDFTINSFSQLQTNSTLSGTSFLATSNELSSLNSKEWRFWIKMTFSPSSNNYARVYLSSSNSDLTINPDGFYLLFGETGSTDAVRLFNQINGISTEICSGIVGQISTSFAIGVKVVRDNLGNWSLFIDSGGGENYNSKASGYESSSIVGPYFGIICTYTASNANKFYFDNFYIGNEIVDNIPPTLFSAIAIYANQIDLMYDEVIENSSAQNPINYWLNPTIGISGVVQDLINPKIVHISLTSTLINGQNYSVTSTSIQDLNGNTSGIQSKNFTFLVSENPVLGDVILTEFMVDPTPIIGLAEVEYVEIQNRSSKYFNIQGWKIGDSSGDGTIQEGWLMPGEIRVLCSTSSMLFYPNGFSVSSFPSFNNSGDDIVLKSNSGINLDKIQYTDSWYHDDLKKMGGYSIERINPDLVCSGEANWKASNSILGGTPFGQNSVIDLAPDNSAPSILSIDVIGLNSITVNFNEGMDSITLANSVISFYPNLIENSRTIEFPFPTQLNIQFSQNLIGSLDYLISINSISDCSMNSTNLSGVFVLPEIGKTGDLVINEILFDPLTGGSDFVEVMNISKKTIDVYGWSFANYYNSEIANEKMIQKHFNLKPNEFVVISSDTLFIKQHYPFAVSGRFLQSDLPNFNNDSSTVYLISDSMIVDKVAYLKEWQFKLLDETKGKSLERINPKDESNISNNWHTAAESESFATPGYLNSQALRIEMLGDFNFSSKTISPDNDGFEDVLIINYKMETVGMVGTFTIYDDVGRLIRTVFNNQLLGVEGTFTWDGLTDKNEKSNIGPYVGVFETFDIKEGMVFTKKKVFVVAGLL